jgi:hypothetical protein
LRYDKPALWKERESARFLVLAKTDVPLAAEWCFDLCKKDKHVGDGKDQNTPVRSDGMSQDGGREGREVESRRDGVVDIVLYRK